jgi:hypothetical protein
MTRKSLHTAWLAGISGAAAPFLLLAAWTALSMMWRPPMSRVAAFLDPHSVHRSFSASTIVLDASAGVLIGLAVSLLIARLAQGDHWLACLVFLSGFVAVSVRATVLLEGWGSMPRVLGQPLIFGFIAAVIGGAWLAPRIATSRKPRPGIPG